MNIFRKKIFSFYSILGLFIYLQPKIKKDVQVYTALPSEMSSVHRKVRHISFSILFPWRLLSPADNLCKQFGPRSGPTERQS